MEEPRTSKRTLRPRVAAVPTSEAAVQARPEPLPRPTGRVLVVHANGKEYGRGAAGHKASNRDDFSFSAQEYVGLDQMSLITPVRRRSSPSITHQLARLTKSRRRSSGEPAAARPSCFGPNVPPAVAAAILAAEAQSPAPSPSGRQSSMRSFRESEDRASVATASDRENSSSLIDRANSASQSASNDRASISGEFSGAQLPEGSKVRERQGFRARHILRITYLSPQGSDCRLDIVFSGASRLRRWQEGLELLLQCPPWPWLPRGEALWARRVFNAADVAREGLLEDTALVHVLAVPSPSSARPGSWPPGPAPHVH